MQVTLGIMSGVVATTIASTNRLPNNLVFFFIVSYSFHDKLYQIE